MKTTETKDPTLPDFPLMQKRRLARVAIGGSTAWKGVGTPEGGGLGMRPKGEIAQKNVKT